MKTIDFGNKANTLYFRLFFSTNFKLAVANPNKTTMQMILFSQMWVYAKNLLPGDDNREKNSNRI